MEEAIVFLHFHNNKCTTIYYDEVIQFISSLDYLANIARQSSILHSPLRVPLIKSVENAVFVQTLPNERHRCKDNDGFFSCNVASISVRRKEK